MEAEAIAWILVIVFGVLFLGALLTILRTLTGVFWLAWRILTYPARVVMRLF